MPGGGGRTGGGGNAGGSGVEGGGGGTCGGLGGASVQQVFPAGFPEVHVFETPAGGCHVPPALTGSSKERT